MVQPTLQDADGKVGRILVVEDDPSVLRLVSYILTKEGHCVDTAKNGLIGWEMSQQGRYDLILTDVRMPVMGGLELVKRLREASSEIPMLVLSAFGNQDVAIEALKVGAYDYLKKPIENQRLRAVVRHLLLKKTPLPARSRTDCFGLIGQSEVMQRLFVSLEQVAGFRTPVLILGEPGVGKRQAARALHLAGPWAEGPFEVFQCEETHSDSLEAILWGRPGMDMGDNTGVLETARGGTMLLAELGHLSEADQKRLLSLLKSGTFHLGAVKTPGKQDVRFVSTTNTAIRKAIEEKTFQEDLLYRLRGVVLEIPPLRERTSDIPLLISKFASIAGVDGGDEWFDEDALAVLGAYHWPENSRELKKLVEDLAGEYASERITPDQLPKHLFANSPLTSLKEAE